MVLAGLHLIPRVVAFRWDLPQAELDDAAGKWSDVCPKLELLTLPRPEGFADDTPQDFARLGHAGLQWTRGSTSLCLGGGDTLQHEIKWNSDVTFHVWPVPRKNRNGETQTTDLAQISMSNVVVHNL